MVKAGICLLSFIKYLNLFFKINNAFLINCAKECFCTSQKSELIVSSFYFIHKYR